ncbi:MAG: glycosyltransferase [Planctomycetota bacterium]
MRVALVHECIVGYHGSERVLAALATLYPEAPIFTVLHDEAVLRDTPLEGRELKPTFLHNLPGATRRHRWLLPWMPYAVEQHDLRGFDVVISSHHAAAHGVLTRADQLHLAYTHSPARYVWDLYHEHIAPETWSPVKRRILHRFRGWDQRAAQRVDHFFANSDHVARRIARAYRRSAEVVHPPVEVGRFAETPRPFEERERYVTLGRHVPYKRTHVVVEAFAASGLPLTVVGDGPEHPRLRRLAEARSGVDIRFVRDADDASVVSMLRSAKALVFAGEEDFGITLAEALAAGTPVLAWNRGGAREIVEQGGMGLLFPESTADAVNQAVAALERDGISGSPDTLAASAAERFSKDRFVGTLGRRVGELWKHFSEHGPTPV